MLSESMRWKNLPYRIFSDAEKDIMFLTAYVYNTRKALQQFGIVTMQAGKCLLCS